MRCSKLGWLIGMLMAILSTTGCSISDPSLLETPPPVVITSFKASPEQVSEGGPVTLTWSTTGATHAWITYADYNGMLASIEVPPSGSLVVDGVYLFDLHASNSGYSVSASVAVKVVYSAWVVTPQPRDNHPKKPWIGEIVAQYFDHGIMLWARSKPDQNMYALCNSYVSYAGVSHAGEYLLQHGYDWDPSGSVDDSRIESRQIRDLSELWHSVGMGTPTPQWIGPKPKENISDIACLGKAKGPVYTFDGFHQCTASSKYVGATCYISGPNKRVYRLYGAWSVWYDPNATPTPTPYCSCCDQPP